MQMEFKKEELVEREIEIGSYLLEEFSIRQISGKTGLQKKIIEAHIKNMMRKLMANDVEELKKILADKQSSK